MFLIEIGANDGIIASKTRKLITTKKWKGILIEPVPYYFAKLQQNYKGYDDLILLNIAISQKESTNTIYKIDPSYLPPNHYGHGVSSFNRKHAGIIRLEKEFGTKAVLSDKVQAYPISKIIKEHNVKKIDLMVIDTEGHDFNVIKSIDFDHIRPTTLIYENKHLHTKNAVCEKYLRDKGYKIKRGRNDTICKL